MSKTGRINHRRGNRGVPKAARHISVRAIPRDEPDLRKLSRALLAIALKEMQHDATLSSVRPAGSSHRGMSSGGRS